MKNLFWTVLVLGVIFGLIYLLVNSGVLLWYIINPNGITGTFWFYSLFSGGISFLIYLLTVLVGLSIGLISKNGNGWDEKMLFIGLAIVSPIFFVVFQLGPGLFINKALSDKNKYINVSTKYFYRGQYQKALKYADELYIKNATDSGGCSRIWFMKHRFLKSEKGTQVFANRKYQSIINYAFCLESLGRELDLVDSLYVECENLQKVYFPDNVDYSLIPIVRRANLYLAQGKVVEAEKLYSIFLSQMSRLNAAEDKYLGIAFMSMYAQHCERIGDLKRAESIREHALDSYHELFKSRESSFYLRLVLHVVKQKIEHKQYDKAYVLLASVKRAAWNKRKKTVYVEFLNEMAKYEEYAGDIRKAEKNYRKAYTRSRKKSAIEEAKQATVLGNFYFRANDYKNSQKYFEKAMELYSQHSGQVPVPVSQLLGLILSKFAIGEEVVAKQQMFEFDSKLKTYINQTFILLSSEEKEKFVIKMQERYDVINAMYLALNDSLSHIRVYDNSIALKSIAYQSNRYIVEQLGGLGYSRLEKDFKSIQKEKTILKNRSLVQTYVDSDFIKYKDSLNIKERMLLEEIYNLKDNKPFDVNAVNFETIKKVLSENEVAVEFINCPVDPITQSDIMYYALIIKASFSKPLIVPLFREKEVSKALAISNTKQEIDALYSGGRLNALYTKIIEPLSLYINEGDKAFFSLSGVMHKVSIPALVIDEPYTVEIVSSTRQLADMKGKSLPTHKSLLYGGISYAKSESMQQEDSLVNMGYAAKVLDKNFNRSAFADLPGTKDEVDEISRLLIEKDIACEIIMGTHATELSFRDKQEKDINHIHIATHGFFYSKAASGIVKSKLFGVAGDYALIENPMNRSGIVFAESQKKEDYSLENDGVLTANEIAGLNYEGTNLVVLSACETGLGDVLGSEGVYGLQRAFKLAGVESILMSLWKVPDKETSELMVAFYKYYLNGFSASLALKKAQKEMKLRYKDPYCWAGFYVVN